MKESVKNIVIIRSRFYYLNKNVFKNINTKIIILKNINIKIVILKYINIKICFALHIYKRRLQENYILLLLYYERLNSWVEDEKVENFENAFAISENASAMSKWLNIMSLLNILKIFHEGFSKNFLIFDWQLLVNIFLKVSPSVK